MGRGHVGADTVVGLLHPGEMGAAVAMELRRGRPVLWASSGRSVETAQRAEQAGLRDVRTVEELTESSDIILAVCPPHGALALAEYIAGFKGIYVDANAVSPMRARQIASVVEEAGGQFVDGGIVGPPPNDGVPTALYLSGAMAPAVAELFRDTVVRTQIVSDEPGSASAVKMAYAAWTKGTAALLLAIRALARAEGVEAPLLEEWQESVPGLPERSDRAALAAGRKGWRWVGEMDEIASMFAAAGLPDGFHRAAAEVYRRSPRLGDVKPNEALDRAVAALLGSDPEP